METNASLSYCSGFIYRPKFISADVYAHQKLVLQKKSLELIEVGKGIKESINVRFFSFLFFFLLILTTKRLSCLLIS